jgi:hypothetical protein
VHAVAELDLGRVEQQVQERVQPEPPEHASRRGRGDGDGARQQQVIASDASPIV